MNNYLETSVLNPRLYALAYQEPFRTVKYIVVNPLTQQGPQVIRTYGKSLDALVSDLGECGKDISTLDYTVPEEILEKVREKYQPAEYIQPLSHQEGIKLKELVNTYLNSPKPTTGSLNSKKPKAPRAVVKKSSLNRKIKA